MSPGVDAAVVSQGQGVVRTAAHAHGCPTVLEELYWLRDQTGIGTVSKDSAPSESECINVSPDLVIWAYRRPLLCGSYP